VRVRITEAGAEGARIEIMSKLETPMTEGFWENHAKGAYIREYCLVRKGDGCARRLADAVILPDEPHRRATMQDYPDLARRSVIVVQTKASRMGMYLMGQAVFSARLVMAQGAASVRSILLCIRPDSVLLPFLKPYPEVEVWISDPNNPQRCTRISAV
jgi:hypothetical protein